MAVHSLTGRLGPPIPPVSQPYASVPEVISDTGTGFACARAASRSARQALSTTEPG
ncbi:hypothetical protein [Ralstonia solanacearum]|uniref:hypothetical protein n=1 Tax=Ralstonia solanacearum TaxID=305 RepID=UPI0003178EB4|nr:hypothetical protein [Ralstonia solanacearum]MDC6240252.1 hypothetical protein [Ralstonia solanacearum]